MRYFMTDDTTSQRDYSKTLFLPETEFPMQAGLPKKEPEIIAEWDRKGLWPCAQQDFERYDHALVPDARV